MCLFPLHLYITAELPQLVADIDAWAQFRGITILKFDPSCCSWRMVCCFTKLEINVYAFRVPGELAVEMMTARDEDDAYSDKFLVGRMFWDMNSFVRHIPIVTEEEEKEKEEDDRRLVRLQDILVDVACSFAIPRENALLVQQTVAERWDDYSVVLTGIAVKAAEMFVAAPSHAERVTAPYQGALTLLGHLCTRPEVAARVTTPEFRAVALSYKNYIGGAARGSCAPP